ncbi:MAG: dihydroorotate dehydrogenase electron transfer subunit [Agathobacter sp.]|nr:dihydroorotate dehydrogenase electron transfer subunit [Agathobacter sp.]
MREKFDEQAVVVSQSNLVGDIYDLTIKTENIAKAAKAGQFVSVYSANPAKLLPRPISLCGIDKEAGTIRLVYRVTGENTGTEEFSKLQAGDSVHILGPLGNGFTTDSKKAFLIGGGIGVPPMLQLAKNMKAEGVDFDIVMGYRDNGTFLKEEFDQIADTYVATEDGSLGTKGNVIDAIRENGLKADVIYACGPKPMLRALKQYAQDNNMECFVSMEEKMACGIGACLACVCQSTEQDHHSNVNNKRVCKEGPVFDAKEVEL